MTSIDGTGVSTGSTIRTLDLFAGAGGLSRGLRAAGSEHPAFDFVPVRAVESDPAAAATFDANYGEGLTYVGSIEDWLESEEVPEVDLVVGGPPCQGFSALNRGRVGVERNRLWERYADAIVRARPKWFVLENVSNFRTAAEYDLLVAATRCGGPLEEWALSSMVLLAADYGTAQMRKRTVVIGHHRDSPAPSWPVAHHNRQTYRTVADAFEGLEPRVRATVLPDRSVSRDGVVFPGPFRSSELHLTRRYTELSLLRFGHIRQGENRFKLPDELKSPCWLKHTTGSADVLGRLRWNKPSVTVRTEFFKPEKGRYLHPSEHRAITHHEAARLQGFPDDYLWVGSKVQIARQIGNAVPIELGRAIGRSILACARGIEAEVDDLVVATG